MAFTKEEKAAMVARYGDWLKQSQAVFMLEFSGMTMKDVEELRRKGYQPWDWYRRDEELRAVVDWLVAETAR